MLSSVEHEIFSITSGPVIVCHTPEVFLNIFFNIFFYLILFFVWLCVCV